MTYISDTDQDLQVSRDLVPLTSSVLKFGRSTNVDSGIDTDIWDRANATNDQDIWIAPTAARTHQIVSSSTDDDGSPVGLGARTIRVYGLTSWSTAEVSEDITMNGTTKVPTANTYVIIYRMKVLTCGATSVNVGLITATADTDATVTAQINAGEGQTQMAIYGVPSTKTLYLTSYYASVVKTNSVSVSIKLLSNQEPGTQLTNFTTKHTIGVTSVGDNYLRHEFRPYYAFDGPCIIKMQGNATANNCDVSAGFQGVLITN